MKIVVLLVKWHFIGTTQVRLSSEAFKAYIAATGAVLDDSGSYIISSDQFNKMQNLTFTISGVCIFLNHGFIHLDISTHHFSFRFFFFKPDQLLTHPWRSNLVSKP